MNLRNFIAVIFSTALALPAVAQVDGSDITTFEDGTPAVAGEVNANFQALIDAINGNASRIAALEASSGSGSNESNSVSGATFSLQQIGNIVSGNSDSEFPATTVTILSQSYSLTFNSDGSLTLDGSESEADLGSANGSVTVNNNGAPVNASGTWSQSGSTISTDLGSSFTVSADGNVIVVSNFTIRGDGGAETSFLVGVRTN